MTHKSHKDPQPTNSPQLTAQVGGADTFSGVHEVTLLITTGRRHIFLKLLCFHKHTGKLMSTEADVNPTNFYLGNTKEICQNARFLSLMLFVFKNPRKWKVRDPNTHLVQLGGVLRGQTDYRVKNTSPSGWSQGCSPEAAVCCCAGKLS